MSASDAGAGAASEVRDPSLLHDRWLIAVVAWVALFGALMLWLTQGGSRLTPDATDYAEVARSLVRGQGDTINRVLYHVGLLPKIRHTLEVHGLATPLFIAPLFAVWGPDAGLVRIPSVIFLAGLLVLVFHVGRRLGGTAGGLIAAALLISRSDLVLLGVLGSDDVGHAFFVLASVYYFSEAVRTNTPAACATAALLAAAAALQKFAGVLLGPVFTVALVFSRDTRSRAAFRAWLAASLAICAVVALYALRNQRVYGSPGSPYAALEWFGKENLFAYFAYYDTVPSFGRFLATRGVPGVLRIVQGQLEGLFGLLKSEPMVWIGAPSLVWLHRRQPLFARLTFTYSLGIVFLLCVLHHVEPRYFAPILPLSAVAVGAAVASLGRSLLERMPVTTSRRLFLAGGSVFGGLVALASWSSLAGVKEIGELNREASPCAEAIARLKWFARGDEPVLTTNPYMVSWEADLPAVVIPTNGPFAVMKVAMHYRARWAFVGANVGGTRNGNDALWTWRVVRTLRPQLIFDGAACDVYRLRPIWQ